MSDVYFTMDTSEYDKWLRNLKQAAGHFDDEIFMNLLMDMANDILEKTIKRTPVRTGDLRRAWHLGNIVKYGNMVGIEIINNSYHEGDNYTKLYGKENTGYYASFIEYGFRFPDGTFYPPRLMLTTSINEIKSLIPMKFNKAFDLWIKSKEI